MSFAYFNSLLLAYYEPIPRVTAVFEALIRLTERKAL
jgi:hypothetical protein